MRTLSACTTGLIPALCAQEPGLTPKAINELFAVLDRDSGKYSFAVSVYMLELYQDDLADLLLPPAKLSSTGGKVSSSIFLDRTLVRGVLCSFVVSGYVLELY